MLPSSRVGARVCLLLPGELEGLFLHGLLTLQKFLRREANGTCSLDEWEPHLGLTASCLEAATLCLQQKALLLLPLAKKPAYVVIKNLTRGFHSNPERNHRAPQENTDRKLFVGRP